MMRSILDPGAEPVVIDGGLSTQLEAMGHDVLDPLWTARVLIDAPEIITAAHRAFIDAGARVVITASYQVSRQGFRETGRTDAEADAALRASVRAARDAGDALVAASVGPYGAISHDGAEYRGRYGRSIDELAAFHAERIAALVDAEPDLLAIETIPDADEVRALAEVLDGYPDVPAWVSLTCADDARLWAGQPVEEAVRAASAVTSVIAIGVNCTDPAHVAALIERITAECDRPVVAYPNAGGVWDAATGAWQGASADALAERARTWRDAGAGIIGGCCGTDARSIAAIAQELSTR